VLLGVLRGPRVLHRAGHGDHGPRGRVQLGVEQVRDMVIETSTTSGLQYGANSTDCSPRGRRGRQLHRRVGRLDDDDRLDDDVRHRRPPALIDPPEQRERCPRYGEDGPSANLRANARVGDASAAPAARAARSAGWRHPVGPRPARSRTCQSAGKGPAERAAPSVDRCRASSPAAPSPRVPRSAGRSGGSAACGDGARWRGYRTTRRAAAGSPTRWRTPGRLKTSVP